MRMLRLRFSPLPDSIGRTCPPARQFRDRAFASRKTLLITAKGFVNGGNELNGEDVVIALIADAVVLVLIACLDELGPAGTKTYRRF